MVAMPVGAAPAPLGDAGPIVPLSSTAYENKLVGEVWNSGSQRRKGVVIRVTYYDESEAVIGTVTEPLLIDQVAAGGTSPFVILDTYPDAARHEVTVINHGVAVAGAVAGAITVTTDDPDFEGEGITFTGTLRAAVDVSIKVTLTTFDADGNVIDVGGDVSSVDIEAGVENPWTVEVGIDEDRPMDDFLVQVDGYSSIDPQSYYTSWDNYFDDIGSASSFYDIAWLANNGITFGCGPGLYCPTGQVSRDQMASFLARAAEPAGHRHRLLHR